MPRSNGRDPASRGAHQDERERRAVNVFLLVAALAVIGAGIWLVDAMLAARRADDCLSAGRRNCAPIDAPVPR
jgi:hypothetical protein